MDNEQRLKELERRRRRAARLLAAGTPQAEVARRVAVSRQSVSQWEKLRQEGGMEALRRPKRFGRPRKLSDLQCAELIKFLKAGALAAGFATELWTLPRIASLIEQRFAVRLTEPSVWRLLGALGWSVQRPTGQARQRDEKAIRTWKATRWPALKKSLRDKVE
jgi:transposase